MTLQSHARVSNLSNLFKRMSLPTNDLPNEKRQRMAPHCEKRMRLSRPMKEIPHKLYGKRKRMSSRSARELDGNKKRSMLPETRELPQEVIHAEILTRLPIKSIVRFKSVCKSWLSLFSNPQFVNEHNAHQNSRDYDCLVADKTNCIITFSRYQGTFALHGSYNLIGSAKGLVCIHRGNIVSLWNPAIHQSKELHLPPLGYDCLIRAGFGFDPVTNDYKVAICYFSSLSELRYAVYSSNSDLWIHHQFDDADYKILSCKFKQSFSPSPETVVKDCPYWIRTKRITFLSDKDNKYKVLLSLAALKFDPTSNKFKFLPKFCSTFDKQQMFKVVSTRDLLTLMAHDSYMTGMLDIYSLHEDKGCGGVWSKMYCLGPFEIFSRFECLQQGFNYGDEIVCYGNGKIYLYDHQTNSTKCIRITKSEPIFNSYYPNRNLTTCFTYKPSLVFLEGMTSICSENQIPPV